MLGKGSGILGVRVRSPKDNAQIRVTLSSDLILEPSVFSGMLATEGEEYRVNPQRIVDSFSGYQSGNTEDVYAQVYALWKALSKRDVRYSNITATAAASEKVYSQHVRLIDESINNAQANCVDGSVLFASLLRKVGIEPYLVVIPGHCYVAFQADKHGKTIAALETTLIRASLEGDAKEVEELSEVVDEDEVEEASWVTFTAAFVAGRNNLQKVAEKLKDAKESGYVIISVADAQKRGILPIAFRSDAKFNPVPATDDSSDDDPDSDDRDD